LTQEPIKATIVDNGHSDMQKRMEETKRKLKEQGINFENGIEIDTYTGEVLPTVQEEEEEITIIQQADEPEYIQRLKMLEIPDDDKLALLSVYENRAKRKSFKEYINQDVLVYGIIIWYHPPFIGKNNPDIVQPAYEQILFLSEEEGVPIVIDAAKGALSQHIYGILNIKNWFLWQEPVKYRFFQDATTNAFSIVNQDRVKSILATRKK